MSRSGGLGGDPSTWMPKRLSSGGSKLLQSLNYLAAADRDSDLREPSYSSDPMVRTAITTIPAVRQAFLRIRENGTRALSQEKWGEAMTTIMRTIEQMEPSVDTNTMACKQMAAQMASYADELHDMVDALNDLLATSTVHHLGMGTQARERFFTTLVAPLSGDSIGYTPTEAFINTSVRKYSATVNLSTFAPTNMVKIFLPAIIERNGDNGCSLYVKGYEDKGSLGLRLTQDNTTIVIPVNEARWGHVSSAFAFRNVNASVSTLGTVSATAIAPSTRVMKHLTQSSLVNFTTCAQDRNVRAVPQSRQIIVRNDCNVLNYIPRSVSTVTRSSFSDFVQNVQDMSLTAEQSATSSYDISRRLVPIQFQDQYGTGAQNCSPYFSRVTPDPTQITYITWGASSSGNRGAGYTAESPPTITIAAPTLVGGVQYGTTATAVATINPAGNIIAISITCFGHGYLTEPVITVAAPPAGGTQAVLKAILQKDAGSDALTGACLANVYTPAQTTLNYSGLPSSGPIAALPVGAKRHAWPSFYPLSRPNFGGNNILRIGAIDMDSAQDGQPILGVRWRVKGSISKTWGAANASITQDTTMQYLYLFTVCESDSGVSYGFPYDATRCQKGQILIPTPWDPSSAIRTQTPQGVGYSAGVNDSGSVPQNYALINLNTGGTFNMALGPTTETQRTVPCDATIEVDNTQGDRALGTGFWPYAISCSDGNVNSGTVNTLTTMNQAIMDPDGWSVWNRGAQIEFKEYKPFNMEKSHLYAMVVGSAINGGADGGASPDDTDWAMSGWDLSNVTVEVEQMRYQPEADDRMAMLIASNQGEQQFGIQCDVNALSAPKDDEIQAFPVPGYAVKTEDLCEMTRSLPNAQVGSVVTRSER